jgi:hypothetical protein
MIQRSLTTKDAQRMALLKTLSNRLTEFLSNIEVVVLLKTMKIDLESLRVFCNPLKVRRFLFYDVNGSGIDFDKFFRTYNKVEVITLKSEQHIDYLDRFCKSFIFLSHLKKFFCIFNPTRDHFQVLAKTLLDSASLEQLDVENLDGVYDSMCDHYLAPVIEKKQEAQDLMKKSCAVLCCAKKLKTSVLLQSLNKDMIQLLVKRILATWSDTSTWIKDPL